MSKDKQEYTFGGIQVLQHDTPGMVWISVLSVEGPVRTFEAGIDDLEQMGAMMLVVAARLKVMVG